MLERTPLVRPRHLWYDLCPVLVSLSLLGCLSCSIINRLVDWSRFLLITFAQYVIITVIILPETSLAYKVINLSIFEFFTFMAFSAHLRTMFTDPVSIFEIDAQN